MQKRTFSLILPLLVLAACGSTAGTPSPAAPSAAAPSEAPPSVAASPSTAPASVAPSEPPASVDPGAAFNDETLGPVLTEITTALQRWGEAATAAAASDADDSDKIALTGAAFRVKVALESGTAILTDAETPECATAAKDQALSFIADLTSSSTDLLADDSASPEDVGAVIQQAADGTPALTEAVTTACAA
jgi:hypothetical protein